ncbi:MAG: EamA family transporter [Anaerolineae bacterium]|nr:EamA family transporter [Anaerolineae bacterium]MDW8067970.1 EamA family transporter [Anaerolineae bacterium]
MDVPLPSRSASLRGYLICGLATAIWSTTAIFIADLNTRHGLPPLVLAFWRDLFVVLGLGAGLALIRPAWLRLPDLRRRWPFFAAYGLTLAIFNALWTTSVTLNGAAVATVLIYSSPAITTVLERYLFGERLNRFRILALALSLMGCVLTSGAYAPSTWRLNPLGLVVGLASGAAFSAYSLFGRATQREGLPPWTATLYAFASATAFLALLQRPATLFWLGSALDGWAVLLLLALVPTIGGYGLYNVSLAYLPAGVANLIVTLEPVMTGILAFLFLGERMTVVQLLGGAMILSGVFLLQAGEGRSG